MAVAVPSVFDLIKCPICLDYAENAMETSCCEQVYCEKCVLDLIGKDCPSCRRQSLKTTVSKLARKIASEVPIECPNICGEKVLRGTLERHKELCPQKEHSCPIEGCEFVGLKDHLIDHEATKHRSEVFSAMKLYSAWNRKTYYCPMKNCPLDEGKMQTELETHLIDYHADRGDFERKQKCPFNGCAETESITKEHILEAHGKCKEWYDRVFHLDEGPIEISNAEGAKASMARNGKFYCGSDDGTFASKADENGKCVQIPCKLDSSLNCDYCMKLDVTLRNLPHGQFVNGAGNVSKPWICSHDVEGSEYFGSNMRSALCRYTTCGNAPKFSCDVSNVDCTFRSPCKDCEHLKFVFSLINTTRSKGKSQVDSDYYKIVWEKQ